MQLLSCANLYAIIFVEVRPEHSCDPKYLIFFLLELRKNAIVLNNAYKITSVRSILTK